jgi:hypothetical protein
MRWRGHATPTRQLDGGGCRGVALMGGDPQMAWYVSYVASGDVSGERVRRATSTFASEREAKNFARAKFDAGDKTLVAGTINPEMPKRVIASSAIPDWLDGAPDR